MSYTNSAAIIGAGTTIGYGSSPTGSFTQILETIKVPMSKPKVGSVETTNNNSPNYTEEKIPGFIKQGDISISANYRADMQALVRAQLRVKQYFQVTFNDGSSDVFYGWISGIEAESPAPDQKITAMIDITITGISTYTS
jgi:hypothetical protein